MPVNKPKAAVAVKKKVVKIGGAKVRSERDIPKYFSDKDTRPINDVWDPQTEKVRRGLSDEEKVAQRVMPPLRVQPNFKKDFFERRELRRVHTGAKGPTGGGSKTPKNEWVSKLIVHLPNPRKDKFFTTTHSFMAKPSEVPFIVGGFIDEEKGKCITKYYYRGQKVEYGRPA